jgi:hypothetical protein
MMKQLASIALCMVAAGCSGSNSPPGTPSPTPPLTPSPAVRASVQAGCYSPVYQSYSQNQIGCALLSTFGSPLYDQAFNAETGNDAAFYGFTTLVVPFDECPGVENALSLPIGAILFGRNLTMDVLASTQSTAGIAGSLAHEWAHQLQFRNGWQRPTDSTVRTTELEADAFSGVYMGLVKGFGSNDLNAYFATLAHFGDYAFTDPGHHGTPEERIAAGMLGLTVANDMIVHGSRPSFEQIHNFFIGTIGASSVGRNDLGLSPTAIGNVELVLHGGTPDIPTRGAAVARLAIRPTT